MIISPNIEDQVLCLHVALLDIDQTPIGLVNSKTTDPEVSNRFAEVRSQNFLPCFPIADLMTLRETISVGVETTGLIGEVELFSLACGLVASQRVATIDSIANEGIAQQVAEGGVETSPYFCLGI